MVESGKKASNSTKRVRSHSHSVEYQTLAATSSAVERSKKGRIDISLGSFGLFAQILSSKIGLYSGELESYRLMLQSRWHRLLFSAPDSSACRFLDASFLLLPKNIQYGSNSQASLDAMFRSQKAANSPICHFATAVNSTRADLCRPFLTAAHMQLF